MQGVFDAADFPDLIIGLGEPDDAAVWRLNERQALVVTTDFFTPVVDDPYDYGAIAAANALSDVYAMGGKPFLALNIAAIPPELPSKIVGEIFRGGAEKARQAGVVIAGGHTVQDKEPKYGLVVIGFVDPEKMLTKNGAKPGDLLALSKPLGFGVTTTALKSDHADPKDVQEVVGWMTQLNQAASELAVSVGVRAATDVTGFSLLGHAWEIAAASGVGLRLEWYKIPFTAGAWRYAEDFIFPGGTYDNRLFFEAHVRFEKDLPEENQLLLFDAQTSGGLLLCVPPDKKVSLSEGAKQLGQALWWIGEVTTGQQIVIV
jgi:selenide,water dikinase